MFNQQKYINSFIKDNYRTLKIRIRKDDELLMSKLDSVDNINKYIASLIMDDIYNNRTYHFINDDVKIDFELSKTMQDLVDEAEKADLLNRYGIYMNYADAIDTQAKNETKHHKMSEGQWKKLAQRYCL